MQFGNSLIYLVLPTPLTGDLLIMAAMMTMSNTTEDYAGLISAWPTGETDDYTTPAAMRGICRVASTGQICAYRVGQLSTVDVDYDTAFQLTAVFDGFYHTELLNGAAAGTVSSGGAFQLDTLVLGGAYFGGAAGSPAWHGHLWELALIEGAPVVAIDALDFGARPYSRVSTSGLNQIRAKNGHAFIYSIQVFNTNAAPRYIKLFDQNTTPTAGEDEPVKNLLIPGSTTGAGLVLSWAKGLEFSYGIGFCLTTGIDPFDTNPVDADEIIVNIDFR
jgi:hypothetical protein